MVDCERQSRPHCRVSQTLHPHLLATQPATTISTNCSRALFHRKDELLKVLERPGAPAQLVRAARDLCILLFSYDSQRAVMIQFEAERVLGDNIVSATRMLFALTGAKNEEAGKPIRC